MTTTKKTKSRIAEVILMVEKLIDNVIDVQVSSQVWREVLAKQRTALAASLTGEIR